MNTNKNMVYLLPIRCVSFVLIFVIGAMITKSRIPYAAPMMIAPIPVWLAVTNVVILPITTAFAEDGLYLGWGVNQIQNKILAITIPAFFLPFNIVLFQRCLP